MISCMLLTFWTDRDVVIFWRTLERVKQISSSTNRFHHSQFVHGQEDDVILFSQQTHLTVMLNTLELINYLVMCIILDCVCSRSQYQYLSAIFGECNYLLSSFRVVPNPGWLLKIVILTFGSPMLFVCDSQNRRDALNPSSLTCVFFSRKCNVVF